MSITFAALDALPAAPDPTDGPQRHATLRLTWPLLVLTPVLLALVALGLAVQGVGHIVSSNGTRWERAQQGSVSALIRFMDSCDPADFRTFETHMGVLKNFEVARNALFAPVPDPPSAEDAYRRVGVPAWEARLLVQVLPRLQAFPAHRETTIIWHQANAVAHAIDANAHRFQSGLGPRCRDAEQHRAVLRALHEDSARLTPLRPAFDRAASRARWGLSALVLACMVLIALPLTLTGYLITRRLQRRAAADAAALAMSERRLRQALRGSGYGSWDLRLDGGPVTCSGTLMALMGDDDADRQLSHHDFMGRLHPDDRGPLAALLRARADDGERLETEVRTCGPDGQFRWLRLVGRRAGPAAPAARLIGSASDVTKRRAMQQALQCELALRRSALQSLRGTLARMGAGDVAAPVGHDTEEEIRHVADALAAVGARLRESNERLQAVFALSPDGFVTFDDRQRISMVTPALQALTGLAVDGLLGQPADAFFAALQAGAVPGTPLPGLAALRARSGAGPLTLDLAGQPPRTLGMELHAGSHPKVHQVLCLRDLTQQRALERLKTEFITVAAHELRTPMTVIYGYAELLMQRRLDDVRREALTTSIHKHCRLMVDILDDLMDLGRLEARQGEALKLTEVQLKDLLLTAADACPVPEGREPPHLQHVETWPDLRLVADSDSLLRAVGNVLGNAYKYSPQGGAVEISLTFHARPGGPDEARIGITDHGIGMAPHELARVGERFYRAEGSGHIPGTGLGMSLVFEIVRLHGGEVRLHSTPGQGTQVDLCLPVVTAPGPA